MFKLWQLRPLGRVISSQRLSIIRPFQSFKSDNDSVATHEIPFKSKSHQGIYPLVLANFSLWKIFKNDDDYEDSPEKKLITVIKRSILSIQRNEYEKAEKMLHLALRMAHDLNSKDGTTYIYDVMANLALEKGDFEKAEKLFVDVMKRLFADGFADDNIKMLAISSKMAYMAEMRGQLDKARQGFEWTLKKLEDKLKVEADNMDLLELWGMTKNWYAQTLLQLNVLPEAKKCFLEAYDVYRKVHEKITEEGLMILNNLGVVSTNVRLMCYFTKNNHF